MDIAADYDTLIDLIISMVDSQRGQKIGPGDAWRNDAQTLSRKLFHHLTSIKAVSSGTTVEMEGEPVYSFIDHSSTKVLARAALETYLVFFFIYGCSDAGDAIFRHMIWKLAGLISRQNYPTLNEENRKKLDQEKREIEELKAKVVKLKQFQSYTAKQQKSLLAGDWRVGYSWQDLGVSAGFHPAYFKMIYNYLCGYAHSSYISALQVGQAQSIEEQRDLASGMLQISLIIMAHFLFTYSTFFSSASEVLNNNPDAKRVSEIWRIREEDMNSIYGKR